MKKSLKWIAFAVITPVLLIGMLVLLFYFPPFQRWAVGKATSYTSQKTGMDIRVGDVRLAFPLDLALNNVLVIQSDTAHPQLKDTLAFIETLVADVQLIPLLKGRVEVNQFELNQAKLNTINLVEAVKLKGTIGKMRIVSRGIDVKQQTMRINEALLHDANLLVALQDSVPEDTTTSQNKWKIQVEGLKMKRLKVDLRMPGDTLRILTQLEKALVGHAYINLEEGKYTVAKLEIGESRLKYAHRYKPNAQGFDVNHVDLQEVNIGVDSLFFSAPQLNLNVYELAFKEKSGLDVQHLSGKISMDSTQLHVPNLKLRTSASSIVGGVKMDLNSFDKTQPGMLKVNVHATLGKSDMLLFAGTLPKEVKQKLPAQPTRIDGILKGNLKQLHINELNIDMPGVLSAKGNGMLANIDNPDLLQANVKLNATSKNMDIVKVFLPKATQQQFAIPKDIALESIVMVDKKHYASTFTMRQGQGVLCGTAGFDAAKMAYNAKIKVHNLALQRFVPHMAMSPFTGNINIEGRGTDVLSPQMVLKADINIHQFSFGNYPLSGLLASATVKNGKTNAFVSGDNELLKGTINLNGLSHSKQLKAEITTDLSYINLQKLGLTTDSVVLVMQGNTNVSTDLKNNYHVKGLFNKLKIIENGKIYRPGDIDFHLLTRLDSTYIKVVSNDLRIIVQGEGNYNQLIKQAMGVSNEVNKQLYNKYIDHQQLCSKLPTADIYLQSGNDNLLVNIMRKYQIDFDSASINLNSSPQSGINGNLLAHQLVANGIQLDTIKFNALSTDSGTFYHAQVCNNQQNPQYIFNTLVDGSIHERGTEVRLKFFDAQNDQGVNIGLAANMVPEGIAIHVSQQDLLLGYEPYLINSDNFLLLTEQNRLKANMKLKSQTSNNGISIHSFDENLSALQDFTISLNQFDLTKLLSAIPYIPSIGGLMNGDFHVIQTAENLSVSSAINVQKMTYEHSLLGDIGAEFVYMPKANGAHFIDGIMMVNNNEVAVLNGTYAKNGSVDAQIVLNRMPFSLINGFIPDKIFGLKGYGDGTLSMRGTLDKPKIDGEIYMDSSYVFSEPYGVEMRFANDPVRFVNSRLLFDNFEVFAYNNSPLNISGYYDFSNLSNMMVDLRMRTQNFELIHAKENARSQAFGKAFVDFYGTMQGPVDQLKLRGMLNVLGSTDMTYVMQDSQLATDRQMDELITFTSFADSVETVILRPKLTGFNMSLTTNIDESARIVCMLNADHTNYIDLFGGGTLRMSYNPNDNFRLFGRYTLGAGEMKYSLPIIPLKTFHIENGSYIEFKGNPMNPILNITATENVKTSVNEGTGVGRVVEFNSGVKLTKTLSNPGIEFVISAPYDMTIQDELNTMTVEERGKVAIAMLASGMYLNDNNMQSFNMNSALNSFLQSEINNIAGNAMRSMGLDLGMSVDNTTTSNGGLNTNYNFRFAKRLWNNRLRIIIGGRVSSGEELMANRDNTFFNNVELEYRLNQNASQYLRLFYNNNTYDWLEGMIGEYGVGFTWRRKLSTLKEIFKFSTDNKTIPRIPRSNPDTITTKQHTNEE